MKQLKSLFLEVRKVHQEEPQMLPFASWMSCHLCVRRKLWTLPVRSECFKIGFCFALPYFPRSGKISIWIPLDLLAWPSCDQITRAKGTGHTLLLTGYLAKESPR